MQYHIVKWILTRVKQGFERVNQGFNVVDANRAYLAGTCGGRKLNTASRSSFVFPDQNKSVRVMSTFVFLY
jgi:hypothetical protein